MARNTRTHRKPKRAQAARAAHLRVVTQRQEDAVETPIEDAEEFGKEVAGIADWSAETAANMAERVFNQSREAMSSGASVAMSMSDRLAGAARMMDVYQKAGEDTAHNLQALFASTLSLGHGLQRMQQAWLGVLDRAFSMAGRGSQAFRNSKSINELAEAQRRLYVEFVNSSVEANTKLLQLAEQVAREAMGHLEEKTGR